MCCPFPRCPLDMQQVGNLGVGGYPRPHVPGDERPTSHVWHEAAELEDHALRLHEREVAFVSQHMARCARLQRHNGMLLCPVRVLPSGSSNNSSSPRQGGAAAPGCCQHDANHQHAKQLVQHLTSQHTPLALVSAAFARGLAAAGGRGDGCCPACPPGAVPQLLVPAVDTRSTSGGGSFTATGGIVDSEVALVHFLEAHSTQLLQVYHCLQLLTRTGASVGGAGPDAGVACPLGCGVGPLSGGPLGAMLHAAEAHASEVYELSRAAAAEAVPDAPGETWCLATYTNLNSSACQRKRARFGDRQLPSHGCACI